MIALALGLALAQVSADPLRPGHPVMLPGHSQSVTALAFQPSGALLASAGRDQIVRLWNPVTGATFSCTSTEPLVATALAFSPDGTRLAAGGQGYTVEIFEVAAGRCAPLTTLVHPDPISTLAFSPDGQTLAVGGMQGEGALYPAGGGKALQSLRARGLAWLPGGRLVVTTRAGELGLVEARSGKMTRSVPLGLPGAQLALVDASLALAFVGGAPQVVPVALPGLEKRPPLVPPTPQVLDVDRPQPRGVVGVAPVPGRPLVAVLSADRVLRIWASLTGPLLTAWPVEQPGAVVVSPDGRVVAVGDGLRIALYGVPSAPDGGVSR